MGIKDGKCDSCTKEVNFLFPIAITQELPTGGFSMIVKYYCIDCYETLVDVAHNDLDLEDEEKEEDNGEEYNLKMNYTLDNMLIYCDKCKAWHSINYKC